MRADFRGDVCASGLGPPDNFNGAGRAELLDGISGATRVARHEIQQRLFIRSVLLADKSIDSDRQEHRPITDDGYHRWW